LGISEYKFSNNFIAYCITKTALQKNYCTDNSYLHAINSATTVPPKYVDNYLPGSFLVDSPEIISSKFRKINNERGKRLNLIFWYGLFNNAVSSSGGRALRLNAKYLELLVFLNTNFL
jgi:hypothetical protein